MALQPKRRQFTVAEYHQMAQAGILGEDDRVELIEGEIVEMTPIGRRHAACVNRLNERFVRVFGEVALVSVQNPIHLALGNALRASARGDWWCCFPTGQGVSPRSAR